MYFTDRGLEELNQRRGEESITFEWLTDQMRTFVDLNPEFETPVERLATWLACLGVNGHLYSLPELSLLADRGATVPQALLLLCAGPMVLATRYYSNQEVTFE